jgi:hypothetical protein
MVTANSRDMNRAFDRRTCLVSCDTSSGSASECIFVDVVVEVSSKLLEASPEDCLSEVWVEAEAEAADEEILSSISLIF